MNDTLMYLVKVNIAIVLFYLFYRLFFAGDTFWKTRRFYLLLSILVSFVYPFLSIETWMQKPEPVQQMFVSAAMLPEFTVSSGTPQTSFITLENVLLSVYALVVLVLLVRMLLQLFSILHMSFQGRKQLVGDTTVIALEHEVTPFSFFGSVFINPALHTGEETRQILAHELTHVRQWHSLDVLAGELLTIAFWFNPATWLFKREMRQNLEFLADNKVIESGFDSKTYQYHLLQLAYQAPKLNLTNKFNVSPLKKRITMMNLQKSKKARLLKYSLVFPLALSLVLTSNAQEVVNKVKSQISATQTVVPAKKAISTKGKTVVQKKDELSTQTSTSIVKDDTVKVDSSKGVFKSSVKFTAVAVKGFVAPEKNKKTLDGQNVYSLVDKMPQFPGGDQALIVYLSKNLHYPAEAKKNEVQGKFLVRFIVNSLGEIEQAEIAQIDAEEPGIVYDSKVEQTEIDKIGKERSAFIGNQVSLLEKEALRVVNSMPQWIPGEQKGKKVAVSYALPVRFKLGDRNEKETLDLSTTTGKDPLYVVDDKVVTKEVAAKIKLKDVESIALLKDAAAIKLYGEKGKDGVLLIKMKK